MSLHFSSSQSRPLWTEGAIGAEGQLLWTHQVGGWGWGMGTGAERELEGDRIGAGFQHHLGEVLFLF